MMFSGFVDVISKKIFQAAVKLKKTIPMAVFMDRHDLSASVTAEHVARLHQEDLKIQDRFSCKGLSYWFDEKRHLAFCLVEAPNAAAIQAMHDYAHGQVANQITKVDGKLVESFLGRMGDGSTPELGAFEPTGSSPFRILMVVSLRQRVQGRPAPCVFPSGFEESLVPMFTDGGGRLAGRSEGDRLISFTSAAAALRVAEGIIGHFRSGYSASAVCRIGLSGGVPLTDKPSLFEDAVRVARKVCLAVQGDVVVSSEVTAAWQDENDGIPGQAPGFVFLTSQQQRLLSLLLEEMERFWSDPGLKVGELSRRMGCSKSGLYRQLMSLTGKSPHAFILEYRLQQAADLLSRGAENVAGAAFTTGFTSPSYFSKCFRRRFGCPPSDVMP
jgi:AraC-like DNA-binding protein